MSQDFCTVLHIKASVCTNLNPVLTVKEFSITFKANYTHY